MLTPEELLAAQDEELQQEWEEDDLEGAAAAAMMADAPQLEEGLFWAAREGNAAVAAVLLKNGASAVARTGAFIGGRFDQNKDWSFTPLIVAARAGHKSVVKLLIKSFGKRVDELIEQKSCWGNTALMAALNNNHVAVVEVLIQNGAKVDATNNEGLNAPAACMYCRKPPDVNMAAWLVHQGASLVPMLTSPRSLAPEKFEDLARALGSASLVARAHTIVPLLEHMNVSVRIRSMKLLLKVHPADVFERSTTVCRLLVRVNRTYTGVLQPLRAHLFPPDVSGRAFITRKMLVEAIARRRDDANSTTSELAMQWFRTYVGFAAVSALGFEIETAPVSVLVAAVQALKHPRGLRGAPSAAPAAAATKRKCGICRQTGHTKKTCPLNQSRQL